MDRELPVDLFLGDPELTPPRYLPFSEVRDSLADALAREKANEEIQETFGTIRDEFIDKFADDYHDHGRRHRRRQEGRAARPRSSSCPSPTTWPGVAKKYGLTHEITPLIDRREAEHYRPDLAGQGRVGPVGRLEELRRGRSSTPRPRSTRGSS